jgi:hypothetical protein
MEEVPFVSSLMLIPTNNVIEIIPTSTSSAALPTSALDPASVCKPKFISIYSPSHYTFDFTNSLSFNTSPMKFDRKIYCNDITIGKHPYDSDLDFSRIQTPYDPVAFQSYLPKANIIDRYPNLAFKLTHGFSLDSIPPISLSYTPKNQSFIDDHSDSIWKYTDGELTLVDYSGPFTKERLEVKSALSALLLYR